MIGSVVLALVAIVPQDTGMTRLPTIEVTISREPARSVLDLPFALTRAIPDSTRPGLRNLTIDERLFLLPGVVVANRNNPTQDPRISIRGFGSRAAFGVRGVRVQYDGVPLTLADGQTALDYLDLESIGSVQVIRGSASSLYGNAAGGVVDLRSRGARRAPFGAGASVWIAEHGQRRVSADMGGSNGPSEYALSLSRTNSDGFRAHSQQEVTNGSLRFTSLMGGGYRLSLGLLAHDMPVAQNPGALTLAEFRSDITAAEPAQVTRRARKEVKQLLGSITLATGTPERGELELIIHGGDRDLNNPLTFAIIDVQRASHGVSLRGSKQYRLFDRPLRLTGGVDYQGQNDDRREYTNCNFSPPITEPTATCAVGVERGSLRRDQTDVVTSVGPFVRGELQLSDRVWFSSGVRADRVTFEVDDRFVTETNPDDSGERTLKAVSPTIGVVLRTGELASLYANFSRAFETPTTTELANRPDGTSGVNPELDPQRSSTIELGTRGWTGMLVRNGFNYDFALFHTSVSDELISFEVPEVANREFFRNAGSTRRTGLEAAIGTKVGPAELAASYTYSHFLFDEYETDDADYSENRIPGVPVQQLHGAATFRRGPWYLVLEGESRGGVYVDDANSTRAPGYEVMNVRVGGNAIVGSWAVAPRIGVQNIFDRHYAASINVGSASGRYFEPAPGRTLFFGLSVGGIR